MFLINYGNIIDGFDMTPSNPAKHIFDDLDRKIIGHLRVDGRAPLNKIADALGVSRGTVQNRLDRLLASGAVLGFSVRVREDYESNLVRAIMLVEVVGRSTTQVIKRLRGFPAIEAVHTTNGNWDLIVEIRANSLSDFDMLLREIRMIEGVLNSETSIMLSSV
jgi:DNA-binding Lrp family transcriptional regulator